MSTATQATPVATLEQELNSAVLEGLENLAGEDVVMQENAATATVGKAANREREIKFLESIEQFHGAQCLGSATAGNTSYSEWVLDVTFKGGIRVKMEQVAVRKWRNGQVSHERFYYNAGNA